MQLKDNTKKTEERKNRFNGESVMLTAEEARRHDNIFINELAATLEDQEAGIDGHSEKWKAVRRDLDWFRQHNASEPVYRSGTDTASDQPRHRRPYRVRLTSQTAGTQT